MIQHFSQKLLRSCRGNPMLMNQIHFEIRKRSFLVIESQGESFGYVTTSLYSSFKGLDVVNQIIL